MTATAIINNRDVKQFTLTGNDEWTGPIQVSDGADVMAMVSGTFTGTLVVQVRPPGGVWVALAEPAFTADTPGAGVGRVVGSAEIRAGFATLSGGTATVTLQV